MQIRKCERVTSYNTSGVANLNPDDFRNISIPFEGETDEEFLTYLNENIYELVKDQNVLSSYLDKYILQNNIIINSIFGKN